MFLHVQSTQTLKVDNLCFLQMSFFYQMCAIPSKNWKGFQHFNIDA
jgi:hypothetical protein